MGKRFTKREVSRLLGAVPRSYSDHAHAPLCRDLARVVRQMRRDLAQNDVRLTELAELTLANIRTHDRLRSQLDEAHAAGRWLDIETAPRDGTKILCWSSDDEHFIARFDGTEWIVAGGYIVNPAHWMPLLDGPGEG